MIHSWMLKNFCCILLQAMMLRLQQADLERAQKLKWMDAYQSETFALKNVQMHRRKSHNPVLRKLWEEKDDRATKSKMDAAFEDCDWSDDEIDAQSTESELERSLSPSPEASRQTMPEISARSPLRLLFVCCCCRRQRRLCGGLPTKVRQTILYIIMGFVLGWLLNQIPFAEMFESLSKTRCN